MSFFPYLPNLVSLAKLCCLDKHAYLICSDNESGGRTPLSKEIAEEPPLIVAPSEDPVIDISDSSKDKRKLVEAAEASPSKKRKLSRKSRTTSRLAEPDNFDDYVDNMDLDASDDVSSQRLYSFPSILDLLLEAPKLSCSVLFAYCRFFFCLAACREESSFDCSQIYESATLEGQPRRYCAEITFCFETLIS